MKNLIKPLILTLFLVIFSCKKDEKSGWEKPSFAIGEIVEKTVASEFDGIVVSTGIEAEIVKSDEEKVIITAPKKIINDVVAEVSNGILHIKVKSKFGINNTGRIQAKIFARDFSSVEATSAASIDIKDKFLQEKMNISTSSSGSIEGNLEANDMTISASSAGSFSGKIWAINLSSKASSSGEINIEGKSKNVIGDASSGSEISAKDFTAENGSLDASSGASIVMGISKSLKSNASSGANIDYINRGTLEKIDKQESSGGSVSETK